MYLSRETAILDMRPNKDQFIILAVKENTLIKKGLSWLEKYLKRTEYEHPPGVRSENVILFEFIQNWIITGKKIRRRSRAAFRIVNLFLLYSSDPGSNNYENYCRVKIMLYYSFTDSNNLITLDRIERSYEFIYYLY